MKPEPPRVYPRPMIEEKLFKPAEESRWMEYNYQLVADNKLDLNHMYEKGDSVAFEIKGCLLLV